MDGYLKQSTATTLKIGPFLDSSDGVSAETGLTIAQADVRLTKNGGNMAQKNEATGCTHDELGYYDCPVDATDTGTLGRLKLACVMAGAAPVWHDYMIVRADVYDTMCSTDYLQVDVIQIGSDEQSATDLKDFADTGYNPTTHVLAAVSLAAIADAIWDEDVTGHTTSDSAGENLNVINDMLTAKKVVSGTSMIHYKQDGTTTRKAFTLDSATNATTRTPV